MSGPVLSRRHVLIAGGAVLAGTGMASARTGTTLQVVIENLEFRPATVKARVGDRIVWVNKDAFDHTATVDGLWDVEIPPGKAGAHVVTARDTVSYHCRYHPNMVGRIKVVT